MAVAERARYDVSVRLQLDKRTVELLERVAEVQCDGNKSAAMRWLIATHAGVADRAADVDGAGEEEEEEPWRRRSLSMALVREVSRSIRAGHVRTDAYRLAGVTSAQAAAWDKEGAAEVREGRTSTPAQWVMMLARAEAAYKHEHVRRVTDPKWLLERQYAPEYGRRSTSDATVTHRSLPMIDLERLTVEEARVFLTLARKASPQGDDPGISARARPIGELLPADIDGEAHEIA